MGKFGWDLPPGCTQNDIDNAFGFDEDETDEQYIQRLEDEAKELVEKNLLLTKKVARLEAKLKGRKSCNLYQLL
jgi:hypothetical protein